MRAAVCSVGTELVVGEVTDSNASWVAQRLVEAGVEVAWHVAVGDHHDRLVATLRWLVDRCDVVVVGGGLGPTPDDLTRVATAEVVGAGLERRGELVAAIEGVFAQYGRPMGPSNLRQADVPTGAVAFPPVGTAPGFRVEAPRGDGSSCTLYVLPGVPHELQRMVDRDVVPDLMRRSGRALRVTRVVHVTGMGESRTAEALEAITGRAAQRDVEIAFLARPEDVRVQVSATAARRADARRKVDPVIEDVVATLGQAVAGVDEQTLEEVVARLLRRAELSVATAESCTAGLVAARLAGVPGATDFLRGGLVTYATDVKAEVLGVPGELLAEHGPVAAPTAEAMAGRARQLFTAQLGVGVTCVAGPTTQGGRPVGTVIWAIAASDGSVRSRELHVPGDRTTVQSRAATAALEGLRRHVTRLASDRT